MSKKYKKNEGDQLKNTQYSKRRLKPIYMRDF